jgi:hypothetical protein
MGPNISFSVDTRELSEKLHQLAKAARVEPGLVMKDEAKQLVTALMKLTPPSTFAQGRKAVASDLSKVYTTVPNLIKQGEKTGRIENAAGFKAAIVKAFRKGDDAAVERLLTGPIGPHSAQVKGYTRNGKQVKGYTATRPGRPVFPNIVAGSTKIGGPLNPDLHTNRRNSRGRVNGTNIGQIVKPGELNAYQKKIQSRVGWHVAGWASLAIQSGAKVAAWITKQNISSASGMASVNFGESPHVRAINRNVKIPGYQRTVTAVVNHRIKITVRKMDAALAGRAVNLGFTRLESRK